MKIEELSSGKNVTIEIVWGENSYEINSQIFGHVGGKVTLKPFSYNGMMVSMFRKRHSDMIFNLYCMDDDGRRTCWNDVNIYSDMRQGGHYYVIETSDNNEESMEKDRRNYPRMSIGIDGTVLNESGLPVGNANIYDISDSGISFIMQKNVLSVGDTVIVKWSDRIKDKTVNLQEEVSIIRCSRQSDGNLYGCKLLQKDRNLLMYILIKRMDENEGYE